MSETRPFRLDLQVRVLLDDEQQFNCTVGIAKYRLRRTITLRSRKESGGLPDFDAVTQERAFVSSARVVSLTGRHGSRSWSRRGPPCPRR
jgi:hypothetical protein